MRHTLKKPYDVTIVGGGIVGLTLALLLARADFNVIVLEKNPPPTDDIDYRVSAIHLASRALFQSLDVWPKLQLRASVFEQIRVFEPSQTEGFPSLNAVNYELQFDSALVNQPLLGFILQHDWMSQVLIESLTDCSVKIAYQEEVASLQFDTEKAVLTLKGGEVVSSRLIVGADGKHSGLRDLLGISVTERDYQQMALVAHIQTEKKHERTAWQCFRPTGPLAFLPLQDENSCSIVWSTTPAHAKKLQSLPNADFESELTLAFENRLGAVSLQSPRFTFPLKMRYATPFVKPYCALVGDAVHTIHPLAGQGLNLGLLDAACLAQVLTAARKKGHAIGDYAVLRRYERSSKSQHVALIAAMEIFKQWFGAKTPPLRWLRKKVMLQLNQADFFKRYCVLQATGLGAVDNPNKI